MKLNSVLDPIVIAVIGLTVGMIVGYTQPRTSSAPPASPTPTPTPSRFRFECKASVDNPCKPRGRIIAYGATCAEAQALLENDLQTLACEKEVK